MVFAIPSLPSLPSLSLRSLIDTEPQVLYPASAANTTPVKHLPPVPDDWGRGRTRRASVVVPAAGAAGAGAARPTHRRTQSAVPHPTAAPGQGQGLALAPLGRLTEYSRNPLASTSALSLPTLAEDSGSVGGAASAPRSRRTSIMSVPPPAPRTPPTPRAWSTTDVRSSSRSRPPAPASDEPSPANTTGKKAGGLTRHMSYTRTTAKGQGTVGGISDVAVMATWSFPPSNPSCSSSSSVPTSPQVRPQGLGLVNASLGPPRNIHCHHRPSLSTPSIHIPSLSYSAYSDTSSSSPTSSLNSLPANTEPAQPAAPAQAQGSGRWISWSRRGSTASVRSDVPAPGSVTVKPRPPAQEEGEGEGGNESDSSHEEYIDFDDY